MAANPGRMSAGVLRLPRRVELVSGHMPEPGAGELRVRVQGCGVCGSDVPVWLGRPWFQYPREAGAPGHEAWGLVDAVGPGVSGFAVGERVTGLMYRGYATHDLVAASDAVVLPEALGETPFPGEALACAINVFRRSGISGGDVVAVVGVGFLGALVVQLASAAGAEVIAISRRACALRSAQAMGAEMTMPIEGDLAREISELTGGRMADVVIEAAGAAETLAAASPLARVRGRLVIAGFHQDGLRTIDLQSWNWRGLDVINAHEREPAVYRAGLRAAVRAVLSGELDPSPLYTHQFGLGQLGEALETATARPDGFMKALVLV